MAISNTSICNQALAMIGAKRINNLEDTTESSVQAIQCRLQFEPTRDALLRSHWWAFAQSRAQLSQDTESPDFEWDNQFILPTDILQAKSVYDDATVGGRASAFSYVIEGDRLLTNEGDVNLRYIRKVTDPTEFDALFVQILVLELAIKLASPLSQDKKLKEQLFQELSVRMKRARAISRQEGKHVGRTDQATWNNARLNNNGRTDSQLGS